MVNFGEKAKIKKVGNLNLGRTYVITTVLKKRTFFGKILAVSVHESKWVSYSSGLSLQAIV